MTSLHRRDPADRPPVGRIFAALLVVVASISGSSGLRHAAADGVPFAESVERFRDDAARLRDANVELLHERERLATALEGADARTAALDAIDRELDDERAIASALAIVAYTRSGDAWSSETAATSRTLAGSTARLRDLLDRREQADRSMRSAERAAARAREGHEETNRQRRRIVDEVRSSGAEVESHLTEVGITSIGAVGYVAVLDATGVVADERPDCHLPAAVLASLLRSPMREHRTEIDDAGRWFGPDGVAGGPLGLEPETSTSWLGDLDGDGVASIDSLPDSTLALGRSLCSGDEDLATLEGLKRALGRRPMDSVGIASTLRGARFLARAEGLGLGAVPDDPALVAKREQLLDGSVDGAAAKIDELLDWSRERLGTPYSQCVGETRPTDPICPEGSDRFGRGFFDCSGYVSAAYGSIGITIPTTTATMEADADFMANTVATIIADVEPRPGDILLADGHVAIWSGDGSIIHADGVELTEEALPEWIRVGTFAVIRPLD